MTDHDNPFLRRQKTTENPRSNGVSHRYSKVQEKRLAIRVNGRGVHRSGAGDEKGDVRVRGVLRIEAKTTKNKSFSVTREMIEKIEMAAATTGELPFLVIEFIDDTGRSLKEVAVCPTWVIDSVRQT